MRYQFIRSGIVMASLMLLCFFAWATDPYPKNPLIDIHHYKFEFRLSDKTDKIVGETSIDFVMKKEGMETLRLDLINKDREGNGMEVVAVKEGSSSLKFSHENDVLLITLSRPSLEMELRKVVISYQGTPKSGLKIAPNKYGDRTFFSDNWPNKGRNWLPMVDHPYDKATCEFVITAPSHYQVISNGLKVEETTLPNNWKLTHWRQSVPIAPWLYVLGAAEFAVEYVDSFEGKSIETWVYRQDRDAGFYDFAEPTKQVLEFYTNHVGPFAYEKLANIQSNSVGGGMEAASAILYGDNSVTGERTTRWRNVVIHEIAHQWFGNAITEYDWDDVWLSEGFATYFTLLFIEYAYGRDEFVEGLKSARKRVIDYYAKDPDYRIVHDNLKDMNQVTNGMTYQKGAWFLHMLRNKMGNQAFEMGIKSYYLHHYNQNATTADFINEMELASGFELDSFFHQWLYQGSNPELDIRWKMDSSGKKLQISIQQKSVHAFKIPVEVKYVSKDGREMGMATLQLTEVNQTFELAVEFVPSELRIDPEVKLLGSWMVNGK